MLSARFTLSGSMVAGPRARRAGGERVRLDQEPLLRQVDHQHPVGVRAARDVKNLHAPRPVGEHASVAHTLHRDLPARGLLPIRRHGRRGRERALEEPAAALVGDHRDVLRHESAEPTRVVDVVVAVDA
jgi:hypothetical protein